MKSFRFILLATVMLLSTTIIKAETGSKEKIYVESLRFAIPLLENGYRSMRKQSRYRNCTFREKTSGKIADLRLVSSIKDELFPESKQLFYTGRVALLPVTNEDNPLLDELNKKDSTTTD